ncbi:hypothetical protein ACFQ0K_17840 [Nocardioides caeni]|uniref:hypothetical protein n=1 Tax=Nocardioides caeni TaxID=574700 RepID=UPI0031E52DFF
MGAANVKAVYHLWGHLDGLPFRVLVYMALVAKDKDDPPLYFAGHRALQEEALRRSDVGSTAAEQATKRAVRALTKEKAITLRNDPTRRTSTYALNLVLGGRSATPREGTLSDPPNVDTPVTHRPPTPDAERPPTPVTHRPPGGTLSDLPQEEEEGEEPPEEVTEGTKSPDVDTVTRCVHCHGRTTIDGECVSGCDRRATA